MSARANAPSSGSRALASRGIGEGQPLVERVERIGNDRVESFGRVEQVEIALQLVFEEPYLDHGVEPIAAQCELHVARHETLKVAEAEDDTGTVKTCETFRAQLFGLIP